MTSQEQLFADLERQLDQAIRFRRHLHRAPDLSGSESGTRDKVIAELPDHADRRDVAGSGAILRIGGPGPAVGLRAELDALPVNETSDVEWRSDRQGIMHSCGHDVHLAALTAVINTLASQGPPMPVLAVLQPREETYPSGARDICLSNVLADQECAAVIGAHVQPLLRPHEVACTPGAVNASADEFTVRVRGTPGHAAYPHLTNDALHAMAQVIVSTQSIVSRSVDPMTPAVVGFSTLTSGSAANIVAGQATATGTLRALDPRTRSLLHRRLEATATRIAEAHSCTAEIEITRGEPVLNNDPELAALITPVLQRQGFTVVDDLRSLGADDFSYFADTMPAVMLFVGSDCAERLHSPSFLPSDADVGRTARTILAGYLGAVAHLTAGRSSRRSP